MAREELRVGTGAYPYNHTEGACQTHQIVGATPCGCPASKRNKAGGRFGTP
jgi:hypothetical protein